MLFPIIKKETKKLIDAKIIVTLIFSKWVANLAPLGNKNDEISLCVDFRNLNSLFEGQFPFTKDGPDFAESGRFRENLYYGWVFRLQSDKVTSQILG